MKQQKTQQEVQFNDWFNRVNILKEYLELLIKADTNQVRQQ